MYTLTYFMFFSYIQEINPYDILIIFTKICWLNRN